MPVYVYPPTGYAYDTDAATVTRLDGSVRDMRAGERAWALRRLARVAQQQTVAALVTTITADAAAATAAADTAAALAVTQRDRATVVRAMTVPVVTDLRDEVAGCRDDVATLADSVAALHRWRATVDQFLVTTQQQEGRADG